MVLGHLGTVLLRSGVLRGRAVVVGRAGNADVPTGTGCDAGRQVVVAVSGLMHQPIVRQRFMPVAVAPQPVGVALRQVCAAVDVDTLGDVVIGGVELAAVIEVCAADGPRPDAGVGGIEAGPDETVVGKVPRGKKAPSPATPSRHGGVADLGEVLHRLGHLHELVVARHDLVVAAPSAVRQWEPSPP